MSAFHVLGDFWQDMALEEASFVHIAYISTGMRAAAHRASTRWTVFVFRDFRRVMDWNVSGCPTAAY